VAGVELPACAGVAGSTYCRRIWSKEAGVNKPATARRTGSAAAPDVEMPAARTRLAAVDFAAAAADGTLAASPLFLRLGSRGSVADEDASDGFVVAAPAGAPAEDEAAESCDARRGSPSCDRAGDASGR